MVDLTQFDTRQAAQTGVDVSLEIDGEIVLGDDSKPVTFTVRGVGDEAVHQAVLKGMNAPAKTPAEVKENDMRILRVAVIGWSSNFKFEGETPKFSMASLNKIMAVPEIRSAVASQVLKRVNFTKKP